MNKHKTIYIGCYESTDDIPAGTFAFVSSTGPFGYEFATPTVEVRRKNQERYRELLESVMLQPSAPTTFEKLSLLAQETSDDPAIQAERDRLIGSRIVELEIGEGWQGVITNIRPSVERDNPWSSSSISVDYTHRSSFGPGWDAVEGTGVTGTKVIDPSWIRQFEVNAAHQYGVCINGDITLHRKVKDPQVKKARRALYNDDKTSSIFSKHFAESVLAGNYDERLAPLLQTMGLIVVKKEVAE